MGLVWHTAWSISTLSVVFFAQKNPILRWALLQEDRTLLKKDGALLTYFLEHECLFLDSLEQEHILERYGSFVTKIGLFCPKMELFWHTSWIMSALSLACSSKNTFWLRSIKSLALNIGIKSWAITSSSALCVWHDSWEHILTATHSDCNTVWLQHILTATHSDCSTFWLQKILTATHSDCNTFWLQHILTATHSDCNTFWLRSIKSPHLHMQCHVCMSQSSCVCHCRPPHDSYMCDMAHTFLPDVSRQKRTQYTDICVFDLKYYRLSNKCCSYPSSSPDGFHQKRKTERRIHRRKRLSVNDYDCQGLLFRISHLWEHILRHSHCGDFCSSSLICQWRLFRIFHLSPLISHLASLTCVVPHLSSTFVSHLSSKFDPHLSSANDFYSSFLISHLSSRISHFSSLICIVPHLLPVLILISHLRLFLISHLPMTFIPHVSSLTLSSLISHLASLISHLLSALILISHLRLFLISHLPVTCVPHSLTLSLSHSLTVSLSHSLTLSSLISHISSLISHSERFVNVLRILRSRILVIRPLTEFFSVLFSKTAIFVDFFGGEVYYNNTLFDWSLRKIKGSRSYPKLSSTCSQNT